MATSPALPRPTGRALPPPSLPMLSSCPLRVLGRKLPFPKSLLLGLLFWSISLPAHSQAWKEVYDPMVVRSLYLTVDPTDWNRIINDQPVEGDTVSQERAEAFFNGEGESQILVEIRRKGPTDPVLTNGGLTKVSLKIDFNALVPGQEWNNLRKLSLEIGNSSGPLAEGFSWQVHRLAAEAGYYHYDAANAAWVKLYVNGDYHGMFTSSEQRDERFLRNRDLYSAANTWLYKVDGGTVLEEGIGDSPAFQHLDFAPFQGNGAGAAPDLDIDLPQWIDMESMLTLGACNAYIENGDGLFKRNGKNSFAADFEPPDQRRRLYFPWDLDGGIKQGSENIYGNFFENEIIENPWFRRVYEHTLRELIEGPLSEAALHPFLDDLEAVLAPELAGDPFISSGAGDFAGLRSWVTTRNASILGQLALPYVARPAFNHPGGEVVSGFELSMSAAAGQVYYTIDGSDPRLPGGAVSPAAVAYSGPLVVDRNLRVTARTLEGGNWSGLPSRISFQMASYGSPLRITEIMYHPSDPDPADGIDEDAYEFLEIHNSAATPTDLSGYFLDGISYTFPPGSIINPGAHIVLVRDATAFATRYSGVSPFGEYLGGLSNGGEKIRLKAPGGTTVLSVEYDDDPPWTLSPDGMGYSLVNRNLSGDPDDPSNWSASSAPEGSPGAADPPAPYPTGLILNEILAHSTAPFEDAVEIHNPGSVAADISGWFLSNEARDLDSALSPALLKKFTLPPGSVVPAGGYLVLYQDGFDSGNPLVPFEFNLHGGRVYLSSADATGSLTGGILALEFPATEPNRAYGRVDTSDGPREALLTSPSFGVATPADAADFRSGGGAANGAPAIGPVVLSEIMYNPVESGSEFVELHNVSGSPVDLSGWDIDGISGFSFPPGTSIPGGGFLLLLDLAKTDEATFRSTYSVPAGVPIFGEFFDLGNGGESLRLEKPNPVFGQPDILVEKVRYNDKAPWPTEADGAGPSLERLPPDRFGFEPLHWRAVNVNGTPGIPGTASGGLPVARNSFWDSQAAAAALDPGWKGNAYNATAWPSVDGPAGYGEPFLRGLISFGPDPADKYPTTYFRKPFILGDDPASLSALTLSLLYDDGVVVYLNGTEVARRGLPGGTIDYSTLATTDREAGAYEPVDLSAFSGLLVQGSNLLAAEVHQSGPASADLVWDAELSYSLTTNPDDVDGDGLPRSWEDANGLDDDNATDAFLDADGDGRNNTAEFMAGTDPQDPSSFLRVTTVEHSPGGPATLHWDAVPGKTYRVTYSPDLLQWFGFGAAGDLTATGPELLFSDPSSPPPTVRWYRIEVLP